LGLTGYRACTVCGSPDVTWTWTTVGAVLSWVGAVNSTGARDAPTAPAAAMVAATRQVPCTALLTPCRTACRTVGLAMARRFAR
jgi:hypothetical protein